MSQVGLAQDTRRSLVSAAFVAGFGGWSQAPNEYSHPAPALMQLGDKGRRLEHNPGHPIWHAIIEAKGTLGYSYAVRHSVGLPLDKRRDLSRHRSRNPAYHYLIPDS
jgi:hypothetical protein